MQDFLGKLLVRNFFDHPVIVVGASRSGTSILLQALGAHPLIYAMPGEAPFLTSIGGSVHLFESSENRDYYLDSIKTPKPYLYRQLKRIGFEIAAGPHFGLKRMLKGLAGRDKNPLGKRLWAAKSFPTQLVTRGLMDLYPDIRFIYIRRNGYDVVQSRTKFHGFTQNDFETQCTAWADAVEKYAHLTELDAALSIKQEDLLQNPKAIFDAIADFLGIPRNDGPANYAENTLVHPLDKATQHETSARSALSQRPPGFENWTADQRMQFKAICGDAMEKAGYEIPF